MYYQSSAVIHDNAIQVTFLLNGIDTTKMVADPKVARKEESLETANLGDNSVLFIYPKQKYAQVSWNYTILNIEITVVNTFNWLESSNFDCI